jgi:23S rRNA (cytosine1962-C5)-methyltransferase
MILRSMTTPRIQPSVFPPTPFPGHELLDSGHGEKLERFGPYVLRRPDPQAMWEPILSEEEWQERSDLIFVRESDRGGRWEMNSATTVPESWVIDLPGSQIAVRPTPFKHVGLFPEQATNWVWTAERVKDLTSQRQDSERPRLLNLFAYTGAATLMASRAGAFVTHVDSSKPAMRWARENAQISGLPSDAVRWIQDDALTFVRREVKRERVYDGVLLDPPPYGRGPDGEKWQFEEHIVELMTLVRKLLAPEHAFVLLSCYAVGTSPLAFANMLDGLGPAHIEAGELALPHSNSDRLLPAGLCGRWWREA